MIGTMEGERLTLAAMGLGDRGPFDDGVRETLAGVDGDQLDGRQLDAFSVRKEPKAHGTSGRIEGCFEDGASVVIVEDVITSGDSALRAVGAVRAAGGAVLGVLALVDREQGGRERLEEEGLSTVALFRASELLD
jgi:orotate phosphoribosyltransferase